MKFSRIFSGLAVISLAFVLMACPYSSSVPLSAASTAVPANFIGTWEKEGSDGEQTEVVKKGDYEVEINQTSTYDGTVTTYRGHFTKIGGNLFLNLKEETEYSSYYFYKVNMKGDFKFSLDEVTPYIRETFEDSDQMRKFFESNMNNSYFYTTETSTYFKVK
ncbi:MAG: hypothetical protein R2809_03975 [Flavobacteriales bacterium]